MKEKGFTHIADERVRMKRVSVIIVALFSLSTMLHSVPAHEISIESCWQDLDHSEKHIKQFGGKWIWSGTFVFKKRSKERVTLDNLDITWQGETLTNLSGSLFKKEPGKQFYPIEDTLISDGQWKQKDQTLHFHFNDKENLNPVTIFCLVLTIPKDLEPKLRKGQFALKQESLPYPFRNAIKKKKLSFSLRPPKHKEDKKIAYKHTRRKQIRKFA